MLSVLHVFLTVCSGCYFNVCNQSSEGIYVFMCIGRMFVSLCVYKKVKDTDCKTDLQYFVFCDREHKVPDKERAKIPNTYKLNIFQESSWQAYLCDWDHSFTLVITASRFKKTLFWEVSPNSWTKGRGVPNYFSKYFSVTLLLSGWNYFDHCMFQKCIVGIGDDFNKLFENASFWESVI